MKIVVNKCFGGYGISIKALMRLIELNSATIESFTPKEYYGGNNKKYRKANEWEGKWDDDFKKRFTHLSGDWYAHSQYDLVYNKKDGLLYSDRSRHNDSMRSNKTLVAVVEELGNEASANLAELVVVHVPDGVVFDIDDYDGIETVREKHRSW